MSSATKHKTVFDSQEPELNIQCPSCKTNFRLELAQLSVQPIASKAKFHCSRCDYVFSAEVATQSPLADPIAETVASFEQNRPSEEPSFPSANLSTKNTSQDDVGQDSPINFVESDTLNIEIESAGFEASVPEVEATIMVENPEDALKEQLSFQFDDGSKNIPSPSVEILQNEEVDPAATQYIEPSSIEPEPSKISNYDWDHKPEVDVTQAYSEPTPSWASYPGAKTATEPTSDFSRYASDFNIEDEDRQYGIAQTRKPVFLDHSAPTKQTRAKQTKHPINTVFFFTIPLLVLLCLLGGLTLHLQNNTKNGQKLFDTLFPEALKEPPVGVFIQDPKIEKLVLDSGDIVNLVKGTLVNQSRKTLSAVTIEALGFSDSGQIAESERIMLGNPISINNVTLKTLTPSNIKEVQAKGPKKDIKIRPDSKKEFSLIFTTPLIKGSQQISSFVVRVYSAKY